MKYDFFNSLVGLYPNAVILKAQVTPTEEVLKVRFKLGQLFELVRSRWARHIRRKPIGT